MGGNNREEDSEQYNPTKSGQFNATEAFQLRGEAGKVTIVIHSDDNNVMLLYVCRLRNLMISEEEQYLHEMSCKKETPLERQARMRERARVLHDRREKERLAFVEQKLDQRWRQDINFV